MEGPLTVESVRQAAIALRGDNSTDAGMGAALLWRDVLRAIVDGHPFARLVAKAALAALDEAKH